MPAWFDRLFPQALPDNQLFAEEIQQVKGPRTPKALLGYSLILAYVIGIAVAAFYIVPESNHTAAVTQYLLAVLGILAIGFALFSDINCTRLAVHSLKDHPADLDKRQLISARLALTEIRSWWLMGIEAAFRVAFFLILFIWFLTLSNWNPGLATSIVGDSTYQHILVLSSQLASAPGAWGVILAMLILLVVQMLEPLWRMRTLATLGMKQAARNSNSGTAAALPNIVIVWGIALFVYIVPGLFLTFTLRNAELNSLAFGLLAYSLVIAIAIWGFYDWLESDALKQINVGSPQSTEEQPTMLATMDQDNQ